MALRLCAQKDEGLRWIKHLRYSLAMSISDAIGCYVDNANYVDDSFAMPDVAESS